MLISELIEILEKYKEKYGDIRVVGQERIWTEDLTEGEFIYHEEEDGALIYL